MKAMRIILEARSLSPHANKDRFAVVERRSGKLYNLHCGHRAPALMTGSTLCCRQKVVR
jgi:hypothetical protein